MRLGGQNGSRSVLRRATLLLLGLGLVWRALRYALGFPLWGDEAFLAVNFLTRDLAGLFARPLDFKQVAPPAFLALEWLAARVFGDSEWSLRLVPFLAGSAALVLFWRFCQGVATRRVTLVAVAILAASYYPVRHGAEVKPYTVDLLVSVAVLGLGWSVWRRPDRAAGWAALGAVGAAGVWVSYPAVFPVAAAGTLLMARAWKEQSRPILWKSLGFTAVTAVNWAAMTAAFARAQQGERGWLVSYWGEGFPPLSQPWKLPLWLVQAHTGGLTAHPHGGPMYTGAVTAVFAVLGVAAVARHRARRPLLLLMLAPLGFALVAAALRRYPYGTSARLMLYAAPAVCLLAAEGIVAVQRALRHARSGPLLAAGLFGLVPVVGMVWDAAKPYHRTDDLEYRRFARRLAEVTEPGDRWVVFDGVGTLPDEPWVMSSVWVQRVARLRYYLLCRAPVPVTWESDAARIAANPEGRTWVVVHDHGFAPVYPHQARAAFEPALRRRLGPPRTSKSTLPIGSKVEVHVFETPEQVAGPAGGMPVRR